MNTFIKVVGCTIAVIILLFAAMMGFMFWLNSSNNADKGDFKEVLKSSGTSVKKALVVFQPSRADASEKVARQLAKGLNEAGFEVTLSYPGRHLSGNVKDYSILAFGSPVFFGSPSKAITNYMNRMDGYSDKKILLYSTGRLDTAQELDVMERCLDDGRVVSKTKFTIDSKELGEKAYKLGLDLGKEEN